MPEENIAKTYVPSEKALKILKDVYECEEKGMANRGVAGISQRTGLGKEDVSAEAWELEREGYLKAYENKRNKGLKTYFMTEKGKDCLPTDEQAAQNDGPPGNIEMTVLEAAINSSYKGSVTARYIAKILRETEGYATCVLKELEKKGYMQRQPQKIGAAEFDAYVINENGRQLFKARPSADAKQAAEQPSSGKATLSVAPGEAPRTPVATSKTEAKPEQPKPAPVPDYLERAVLVFQSSERGSPIRESARDDLLVAMAQKLQELEEKINERTPAVAAPAAAKTGTPAERVSRQEKLILKSVLAAAERFPYVTDAKLYEAYIENCRNVKTDPFEPPKLKKTLKGLNGKKLVRAEKMGCRALGIKERGGKMVYYVTEEGKKAAE